MAHSMSGNVIRYALGQVANRDALPAHDAAHWPPDLSVESVVTFGSPLAGIDGACIFWYWPLDKLVSYQFRQHCPKHAAWTEYESMMWPQANASRPTVWTTVGSFAEDVVNSPYESQVAMSADFEVMYWHPVMVEAAKNEPGGFNPLPPVDCVEWTYKHTHYYKDESTQRDLCVDWAMHEYMNDPDSSYMTETSDTFPHTLRFGAGISKWHYETWR